jgi:hypothetical protein
MSLLQQIPYDEGRKITVDGEDLYSKCPQQSGKRKGKGQPTEHCQKLQKSGYSTCLSELLPKNSMEDHVKEIIQGKYVQRVDVKLHPGHSIKELTFIVAAKIMACNLEMGSGRHSNVCDVLPPFILREYRAPISDVSQEETVKIDLDLQFDEGETFADYSYVPNKHVIELTLYVLNGNTIFSQLEYATFVFRSISSAKQKSRLNCESTIIDKDENVISYLSRNAFEIEIKPVGTDDGNGVQVTTSVDVTEVQIEHIGMMRPRTDDDELDEVLFAKRCKVDQLFWNSGSFLDDDDTVEAINLFD